MILILENLIGRLLGKTISVKYTNDQAVLFTNDGPSVLRCGKIPGILATLDFGAGSDDEIDSFWQSLRRFDPQGPLMNAEYYPGEICMMFIGTHPKPTLF